MDKKVLKQYQDLLREIKDLEYRIHNVSVRIRMMEEGGYIVSDTVSRGKKGKKPLGTVKVEGFPDVEYRKKRLQLIRYRKQLEKSKADVEAMTAEVEEFVSTVEDSSIRRILRYRYMDGNSWDKVAVRMGGGNTADGCRMTIERFLQKK